MKKYLNYKVLILVIVIIIFYLWNRTPSVEWEKEISQEILSKAKFVKQASDDSYVILGRKYDYGSLHMVKVNSVGNILWSKDLMLEKHSTTAFQLTNDGGYLIAGYQYQPRGIWISKLDKEANVIWVKEYEDAANTQEVVAIESTEHGNYMLAGIMYPDSTGYTKSDYWISKIDSEGGVSWSKTFGGSDMDMPSVMRRSKNGNFIIEGNTHSTDGDVRGKNDTNLSYTSWSIEVNDNGELISSHRKRGGLFPSPASIFPEYAGKISYTDDGEYLLFDEKWVGNEFDGSIDVYIEKHGTDTYETWSKILDAPGEDRAVAIDETNDGGCILLVRNETTNSGMSLKLIKLSN